ncbi:hypothetical protein E8E11_000388 [Didymella keratinophila]|nr:hypothetical protein E8E11_000388 [Didymella keratinophila]
MVRGSRHAATLLGVFFNAIREQNENPLEVPGSESDLRKRVGLLGRLCDFATKLPDSLHLIKNLTPQTFHLWVGIFTATYSILRPLDIFSQLAPGQNVSDLLLEYCGLDAHLLERYMAVFDFRETPPLAMSNSFTVS